MPTRTAIACASWRGPRRPRSMAHGWGRPGARYGSGSVCRTRQRLPRWDRVWYVWCDSIKGRRQVGLRGFGPRVGHEKAPAVSGGGLVVLRGGVERQPPILKTLLPHFGHVPWIAGLPFFIVIRCGFWTSTFILSLTQ